MLQAAKHHTSVDEQNLPSQGGTDDLIEFAIGLLWRQSVVIVATFLLCVAIGVGYLLLSSPTYTATAQIITDPRRSQFLQQQSLVADGTFDLESQILIIKSESTASAVIKELRLRDDSEFTAPREGFLKGLLNSLFWSNRADQPKSAVDEMEQAVGSILSRMEVKRVALSSVIEVSFQSSNPERAALIANAIADTYIRDQQEAKQRANRYAGEWLEDRLKGLLEQASAADRAVVAFRSENKIVSADGKLMNDQQLAELSTRLVAARARTSEAQARLNRIQSVLRSDRPDSTVDGTVSDALSSPIVTRLRQQYLDLVNREADYSTRYGPNHLAVVQLRNQIRDTRGSILEELRRLAETYKSDYQIAEQQQNEVEKELGKVVLQSQVTSRAQVKLRELESSAQSYRTLYDNYLRQHAQSAEQQSFPIGDLRVISRAATPRYKSQPKTLTAMAISVFAGLCLGGALGYLRELMDRVFRTRNQVERTLHVPCAAMVPLLNDDNDNEGGDNRWAGKDVVDGSPSPRTIVVDSGAIWTLVNSPNSQFAEALRSVKLVADAAQYGGANRPNRVIGFTSTLPGEGKSTLAAAFAQLAAQVRGRVIVVDCDLHNPTLSNLLTPDAEIGVIEVISGQSSLEQAIWKESSANFMFLPVARSSNLFHTSELLASDWTARLFEQLREKYDYVVVDLPPLAPIVDVRATTHFVDGYFMVIEWGQTKIDVVKHALDAAQGVYDRIIGVILNKTDMKTFKNYDLHHKSYYYNKSFAKYGYTGE